MLKLRLCLLLILTGGCLSLQAEPTSDAAGTVVVYNTNDSTSKELALYYATRRNIPKGNLIGLNCSQEEEIGRDEYDKTIAAPLHDAFVDRGWWKVTAGRVMETQIRFVALIRGIPLKIRPQPRPAGAPAVEPLQRDEASVDSELSVMGLGPVPPPGPCKNPYLGSSSAIADAFVDSGLLLVCRLDGFTALTVQRMIDDSIATEKTGLWGWAYIDSRGLTDGPYLEGDQWLKSVAESLRQTGVPVLWDKAPETLPTGYPVTDAALYFGWYDGSVSGPFAETATRFRPGAVAVHIHSFSASTLRSPVSQWCTPLLERGAAATLGNVYEPYLTLTTHLDAFEAHLLAGFTFAESAYSATMGLSWMTVAIGDPLYRPYAIWQKSAVTPKGNDWALYRRLVLANDGNILTAASALADASTKTGDSMFLESLGAAQADNKDYAGALQSVSQAMNLQNPTLVAFRLALEKLGLLRVLGQEKETRALFGSPLIMGAGGSQRNLLLHLFGQYFPTPAPASTQPPAP